LVAVAQRFYQTHDDTYQILFVFTNFTFNLNGAFAFEINIANQATGIGQIGSTFTFDFSAEFGSGRLESMLNMGNLSRYPADPSQVFLRGVDSTLSIMGQEAGHRFLTYVRFRDPETNTNSTGLLGRDLQHWSFFFNSDASVMEGNRIRDNGNGTFTTTGAVEHYNEFDQYIMGLRPPEEVGPSFLVKNPSLPLSPGTAPALGVNFSGQRVNVTIDDIIAANGPRLPNSVTARKRYNYAFILVTPRGTQPSAGEVSHLDRIRQDWEPFYAQATSLRSVASTTLLRSLQIQPGLMATEAGAQQTARVEVSSAMGAEVVVQLTNSNPAALSVPAQIAIPAGSRSAMFPITALSGGRTSAEGRAVIDASAAGYETASLVVQVNGAQAFNYRVSNSGGDSQTAAPGTTLPQPLRVTIDDNNQIPFPGIHVSFSVVEGDATVSPAETVTDLQGNAFTTLRLGPTVGGVKVRASATILGRTGFVEFLAAALEAAQVSPGGVVNAASFVGGGSALAPGALISIFGSSLAGRTFSWPVLPLPRDLAGTTVEIGGIQAPLLYVSLNQINAQLPFELQAGMVSLTVRNALAVSSPVSITIQTAAPGIFTINSNGRGAGVFRHNFTGLPVTEQDPAMPGEFVQIFATGLGRVTPAVGSGQPGGSQPPSATTLPATVTLNGVEAPVLFAGLAPGFVGLYQVNIQVPEIPPGNVQMVLTVNGVASPPVTIPIGSR
ncbi:MAG: hypothetical protein HY316_11215, partial [Acidobacteria bacterium]|nr:hypothetical protein [Acidobacteriota bacterium]